MFHPLRRSPCVVQLVLKYERRRKFRALADKRDEHPFRIYHGTVSEVTAEVAKLLPEFVELTQRVNAQQESERSFDEVKVRQKTVRCTLYSLTHLCSA